jgi:hypothetical protein
MSKIAVSMQDFLRTGEFGVVSLGLTRRQLRGCLGEPEQWGPAPRAKHNAGVWKYGDIEFFFHFREDVLVGIFADNIKTLNGGSTIDLEPWVLNSSLTVKQALREFEDAGIPCERIEWKLNDGTERFRVGAGVELVFWDEAQPSFNDEDMMPLAPAHMTFHGLSYHLEDTR